MGPPAGVGLRCAAACGPLDALDVQLDDVALRLGSGSGRRKTPSRTVAIWGRCSGLTMVAMMLPPKAGRIW